MPGHCLWETHSLYLKVYQLMMIAELHLHQLGGITPLELQPESYYAVDYIQQVLHW